MLIGLGRFGAAVARSLVRLGHEVLAVESDPGLVQKAAQDLTHVVQANSTDEEALRQIGAENFRRAVVAIGDVEDSVLTVLTLARLGIPDVWAKATSPTHGQILERVGAHHVVYPESAMGERVAHMVTGQMIDFIEFDDGFAIARTTAPAEAVGKTLAEAALRSKYGITVVGVKQRGSDFTYARPETGVRMRDHLIVSGPTDKVERFCALATGPEAS